MSPDILCPSCDHERGMHFYGECMVVTKFSKKDKQQEICGCTHY